MYKDFNDLFFNTTISPYMDVALKNEKIIEIEKLLNSIKPQKLFRYRKFTDYNLNDFDKDVISLSRPYSFNDPYDALLKVDKEKFLSSIFNIRHKEKIVEFINKYRSIFDAFNIEEPHKTNILKFVQNIENIPNENITQCFEENKPIVDYFYDLAKNEAFAYLKQSPRIACFSEDVASTLMWAHYADSHKGFVIEYNLNEYVGACINCDKEKTCTDKHCERILPVRYSDKRFDATSLLVYAINMKLYSLISPNPIIPMDDELIVQKSLITKSLDWKYEKEWRLISFSKNYSSKQIQLKPKAIYLGLEMSDINKKILVNLAKEKEIPIYQMNINLDSEKYSLEYTEYLT